MDDRGKKSRVSAPQYIDYIMTYVQKTINDESIFPTKQESYNSLFLDFIMDQLKTEAFVQTWDMFGKGYVTSKNFTIATIWPWPLANILLSKL